MLSFQEKEIALCLRFPRKDYKKEAGHKLGQVGDADNGTSSRQGEFVSREREPEDTF